MNSKWILMFLMRHWFVSSHKFYSLMPEHINSIVATLIHRGNIVTKCCRNMELIWFLCAKIINWIMDTKSYPIMWDNLINNLMDTMNFMSFSFNWIYLLIYLTIVRYKSLHSIQMNYAYISRKKAEYFFWRKPLQYESFFSLVRTLFIIACVFHLEVVDSNSQCIVQSR